METKKRLNISLDKEFCDELDKECELLKMTRSAFITEACRSMIAERKTIELLKACPEVYKNMLLEIASNLDSK